MSNNNNNNNNKTNPVLVKIGASDGIETIEVLPKLAREGILVRIWGPHDNIVGRVDLTVIEAMRLITALAEAITVTTTAG